MRYQVDLMIERLVSVILPGAVGSEEDAIAEAKVIAARGEEDMEHSTNIEVVGVSVDHEDE